MLRPHTEQICLVF